MRLPFRVFTIALIFSGLSNYAQSNEVLVHRNIVYKEIDDKQLMLDLACPKKKGLLYPALVFIHSGGWQFGNRDMYLDDIEVAAQRGYVAATVSYRLTDPDESGLARSPFPSQIEDVKSAIRWLRENSGKYQIDPTRIGAIGSSAGGHLSLLLGVTDASHSLEGSDARKGVSSRVQAVVNFYGPTDLSSLYAASPKAGKLAATLLGGPPEGRELDYKQASPISYVSADDSPVLTVHGRRDKLVPVEQALRFDKAMQKFGVTHTLMIIEEAGHGFEKEDARRALQAAFVFSTSISKRNADWLGNTDNYPKKHPHTLFGG